MIKAAPFITRFAPSPTGRLHIGHAFSALFAYRKAKHEGGRFILRIEDIDTARCRPEYTQGIYDDLSWLGLRWEKPVRLQSKHFDDYADALKRLIKLKLVYPCVCTRQDIQREIDRSPSAPHGPDGDLYPGTCRDLDHSDVPEQAFAWRLDMQKSIEYLREHNQWPLVWIDTNKGQIHADPAIFGDVVLARKDTPTSYHLSVVVDDALQDITHVIRGEDLLQATHIHRLLQALLKLPTPIYEHHPLLVDENGKRFAKRDQSLTLQSIRESGVTADALIADIQSRLKFTRRRD